MDASEIFKKVRKIEIKTRGLSNHIFSGEYHSMFKGRGMAFSEVREYQYGDDIRSIDWNVTARFNHPFVKIFEEERELTVILLVDVSGSNEFGTRVQLKEDMITEIAAVLSFSAIQNNDKVGIIFFSNRIEKFIPPKKGQTHILRIIRELIDFKPQNQETSIAEGLRYMTNVIKKRSIAFLLSDFADRGFEDALRIASRKHELIALRIYDERERELPDAGLIQLQDAENGHRIWIDSSDRGIREEYARKQVLHDRYLDDLFKRSGTDFTSIGTGQDYVRPLINLFKKRGAKRS
jgi:uncharacterized protein (DUF58 family)